MKFPNPNLLRFIRPTRLQLWCARRGILTGRWTYAETERIRRAAAQRYHEMLVAAEWRARCSDPKFHPAHCKCPPPPGWDDDGTDNSLGYQPGR